MLAASNDDLIASAEAVLNPRVVGGRLFGDVASTLITHAGNLYSGVCIDTGSGTGFCAEHAAIAAMVTAGEYRIIKIVAVWRNEDGLLYVLPPCGRCREFIRQVDEANLDIEVLLGRSSSASLRELLPAERMARAARLTSGFERKTRHGQLGRLRLRVGRRAGLQVNGGTRNPLLTAGTGD